MKKLVTILILGLSLMSCQLELLDGEGWSIYQVGWSIAENEAIIQSHQGFVIREPQENGYKERFFTETVQELPVTVYNLTNTEIDVKINTTGAPRKWIKIPANSDLTIEK